MIGISSVYHLTTPWVCYPVKEKWCHGLPQLKPIIDLPVNLAPPLLLVEWHETVKRHFRTSDRFIVLFPF